MESKEYRNFRPHRAEEPIIKTHSDWTGSFDEDFSPGDRVTEEIATYFAEIVSFGILENNFSQCGEPSSEVDGEFTYTTFIHDGTSWVYCGNCYKGEKKEPRSKGHGE